MAIVDSLLRLVSVRGADTLVVQSGEVPFLLKGSAKQDLSMPIPGKDVIAAMLTEVADETGRAELDNGGKHRSRYSCDETSFSVDLVQSDGRYKMTFRLTGQERPLPAPPTGADTRTRPAPSVYRSNGSIDDVLARAASFDASDVLISSCSPPRARVCGALRMLEGVTPTHEELLAFLEPSMHDSDRRDFEETGSADVAFVGAMGTRYRVNLFKQERGLAAAFRPIKQTIPTLEELNLPASFYDLASHRHGLVLMVGTAGSGKSTTLVSLIEHLNKTTDKHIITLEDPIEYTYTPQRCLIHQREVGRHVSSFGHGLRAALRESPDVILVGEMRDAETISAAITAAETGHLVLSTLHSGNAAMAIHRIVDVFPEHQQEQVLSQIAHVLRAVVTQILLPSTRPPMRVPAYERLIVTSAVSTKIRENRVHQIETELQRGRAEGMIPLELSLARLVKQNLLSFDIARETAPDPLLFEQLTR